MRDKCEQSEERGESGEHGNSPRGPPGGALPLLARPSQMCMKLVVSSPVEQDEVDEVEGFGQEIARDPIWGATLDLIGTEGETGAFYQAQA